MIPRAARPAEGTWFLRDWLWTAIGLIVIDEFASRVRHSAGSALKVEAAAVVLVALVGALAMPRNGAVVPCNPGDPSGRCPDETAVEHARRHARVFLPLVAALWIVYRVGALAQVLVLLATVAAVGKRSGRGHVLRHRDVAWAALGAAAVYLYLDLGSDTLRELAIVALAAAFTLVLMRFRFGVHLVRTLAAIAAAAAAYGIVNALVAAPFVVVITLGLSLVAAVLLAFAIAVGGVRGRPSGLGARVALGVGVLVVGWPLVAGAGIGALWFSGLVEHQLSESGAPNRNAHPHPPAPSITDDGAGMARAYEPFLAMPKGERWRPTSATDYLAEAKLVRVKKGQKATLVGDPGQQTLASCQGNLGADCRLTIDCENPDASCADERKSAHPTLYARAVRGQDLDYHAVHGFGEIRWLIQYWIFYRYDDWDAWAFKGFRQWHASDWELVSIALGPTRPLFVAFSAHCGGIWQPWSKIAGYTARGRRADGSLIPGRPHGNHPVGFVARGSHGTYPDAAVHAPDWESCANAVPRAMEAALWGPTYSSALREHMSYESGSKSFVAPRVVPVSERTPWLQYGGRWGPFDHFRYLWQGGDCDKPGVTCGGGPPAPPTQTSWTDPVGWIFCSPHFQPKGRCPVPNWKPRSAAPAAPPTG